MGTHEELITHDGYYKQIYELQSGINCARKRGEGIMARNKYDVDEQLGDPFDFTHLKRSFMYIKKYRAKMILSLVLSILAAVSGLIGTAHHSARP